MKNLCIDCGSEYEYDYSRPLGSSSSRCAKCRKRDTIKAKKMALLMIAGVSSTQCRKCGYNNSIHALNLIDGVATLCDQTPEEKATTQFILCNNCKAEVEANEVEFKVTSKSYPISVEFYIREVKIVRTQIKPSVEYHQDYESVEVASDVGEVRQVSHKTKRIGGESTIDVSAM